MSSYSISYFVTLVMILRIVCESFDGNPSLLGEIELIIDLGHFSSGLLDSASAVELDFDMLLHHVRTGIKQNHVFSLGNRFVVRQEGIGDPGVVTDHASKVLANSLS